MSKQMNQTLPEDVLMPYFGIERPIVGVEIGTASGISAQGMLWRMPNLTLYTIDQWKHVEGAPYEQSFPQNIHELGYVEALNRLGEYKDRCIIVKKSSDDAVDDVPIEVDFVFIDGHHEYGQVIKDIKNYLPKVRKGGIISGHDYIQVPDVTIAVNEIFYNNEINMCDDFVWWVFV